MNRINWLGLCFEMVCDFVSLENPRDEMNKKYRDVAEHILNVISCINHDGDDETKDDLAIIYYILGYVYSDVLFNNDKSLELYFNALNLYETLPLTEDATLGALYCNIAATYSEKAEYEKANEWHFKALKIREESPGVDDEDVANSYHSIASMYYDMRNFDKALCWGNKALILKEKFFGRNHRATASTLHILADIYNEIDQEETALNFYKRALDTIAGEGYSEQINKDIADVDVGEKKPYEGALKANFNTLEVTRREIGDDNTIIAETYTRIAYLYTVREEFDEALDYYFKALKIYEKILGRDHNLTAEIYNNIGTTYCMLEQDENALEYCLTALKIFEKVLGEKHQDVIDSYHTITSIYSVMGNDEMAKIYTAKETGNEVENEN